MCIAFLYLLQIARIVLLSHHSGPSAILQCALGFTVLSNLAVSKNSVTWLFACFVTELTEQLKPQHRLLCIYTSDLPPLQEVIASDFCFLSFNHLFIPAWTFPSPRTT